MLYRISAILSIAFVILMIGGTMALAAQSDHSPRYDVIQDASPTSDLAPVLQTATALFGGDLATPLPRATSPPKPSATPETKIADLVNFAEPYTVAIEEMQENEIIPLGGSLVYQTGYAFFDGRGRFYTPLAQFRPHTDYIIAAELEYTPSNGQELETCGLMSRIQTQGSLATAFTLVGLANDGSLFYVDQPGEFDTPAFDFTFDTYDLEERHHFIVVVRDDQMWVFVNGELAMTSSELTDREGSYGLAMNATGFGGSCEARGLWIYELDLVWDSKDGYCGVTANQNVILREGPGFNFEQMGQLESTQVMDVEGQVRAPDGYIWWLLTTEEWVRSDYVRELGDCETLAPEVDLPEAEK